MSVGDIVTVMTANGEYVGKVVKSGDNGITLAHPRMIVASESGMGFANGIAMTGIEKPNEVTFKDYTFFTETSVDVVEAWNEHTSQIVMPQVSGIIGA